MEARKDKQGFWIIDKTVNGKRMVYRYSENIYGIYAKILCEMSFRDNKRYKNYIIEKDDYAIIKLYSKTLGYKDVYIDKEDIEKVQICKWGIDIHRERYVCRNFHYGLLHRFILDCKCNDDIVDHIDINPLNNRRSNIRIADHRINNINKLIQNNNTSGICGVRFNSREKVWIARIANPLGKRISKSFSINKYGHDMAKNMAIEWRFLKEHEYGYTNIKNK